jgi:hypothetical protein
MFLKKQLPNNQWQVYETDDSGNLIVGRVWQYFNTEKEADEQVIRQTEVRKEEGKTSEPYTPGH